MIDADNIKIDGTTTFTTGYDPSDKAKTFRQATAPTTGMAAGDIWIDTDDGDRPYTYNGSSWVAALTVIDGGNITTGTLIADKITSGTFTGITFQTAANGNRIELSNNKITFYNGGAGGIAGYIEPQISGNYILFNMTGFFIGSSDSALTTSNLNFSSSGLDKSINLSVANGLVFGTYSVADVNLYRSAADILKTDNNFDAKSLKIGGTERISSTGALSNITSITASGIINSGSIISTGNIQTSDPSGGAGTWQLGTKIGTTGLTLDTYNYVEVRISGILIKLAVVN